MPRRRSDLATRFRSGRSGSASTVRGRPMTPDEEDDYVREVARQKTAALRMSLDAVERRGLPFVGEDVEA